MKQGHVLETSSSALPGGHSIRLQDVEEIDEPEHSFPPFDGPFWVLERVLVPEPHVVEHDDHSLQ